MKKVELARLGQEDPFEIIGKEWMLVTAGTPERFNTMTASWGGLGILWGKPVAFVVVRPERFTHGFMEAQERFTLSFFGEALRDIHKVCGSKSGRDTDKIAATGLRPVATEQGAVTFEQARLTLECRKLYRSSLRAEEFTDAAVCERWYNDKPGGGLHSVYVAEIENVYEG